jgi:hypothetical protein
MAAVICCSNEFKWATSAIIVIIRVTAAPTISTNVSGYVRLSCMTVLFELYEDIGS